MVVCFFVCLCVAYFFVYLGSCAYVFVDLGSLNYMYFVMSMFFCVHDSACSFVLFV